MPLKCSSRRSSLPFLVLLGLVWLVSEVAGSTPVRSAELYKRMTSDYFQLSGRSSRSTAPLPATLPRFLVIRWDGQVVDADGKPIGRGVFRNFRPSARIPGVNLAEGFFAARRQSTGSDEASRRHRRKLYFERFAALIPSGRVLLYRPEQLLEERVFQRLKKLTAEGGAIQRIHFPPGLGVSPRRLTRYFPGPSPTESYLEDELGRLREAPAGFPYWNPWFENRRVSRLRRIHPSTGEPAETVAWIVDVLESEIELGQGSETFILKELISADPSPKGSATDRP